MRELKIDLGERSYPVLVGAGVRHRLAEVIPAGARRAVVVTQDAVPMEVDSGLEQVKLALGPGEEAKTLGSVEELCRGFARFGLTRSDVVVALGGGVVTDVAGFAASAYHRGVAVVNVPTTLLAQVDAAIGGKTGVNLPEGKNLVGAFWQPSAVLCDLDALETLPAREYRSGLGEMAKYAFLGVSDLASLSMEDAVAACVACKAEVVSADERDQGRRALLNYGHTLAHALETSGGYELRHGEAVAVGLVFAAHVARRVGRVGDARVSEHEALVAGYGLPTRLPLGADPDDLVDVMSRDKKRLRSADVGLTMVLDGPAGLEVVEDVPRNEVRAALCEVAA